MTESQINGNSNATRQANLNKASGKASARLKANHLDEWNTLMALEAKALGEDWAPRLSPEQKAEQDLRELLESNPSLRDKLISEIRETIAPVVVD